jgi:hypothetical protein
MQKRTSRKATALALIALALTWGVSGISTGEDFLEKMKKALEESQRKRQQQQQSGQQRQPQQQPRYQPGGGTKLLPNVKPEPSPDFGTPEGTAKIAAKAGFLEVVGIKLGMPAKEAVEALKAHNAGFKPGPITLREYEALPGVLMTPVLYAPNPGGPNATSGDDFNLLLTFAPNEAFVWGIVRNMGFGTNETRPPVDKTLAGLRQKYGPESAKQWGANRLIWIYDADGKQVMGPQAMDIYTQCSQVWIVGAGNNPDRNNQYSNSSFDQKLKAGYYWGAGGVGSPGGVCHTHSALDVYYIHATPAGSTADLMVGMVISTFNHQLEASGITAAHTNLMAAVAKLNEKRGEEEGKRGGMKF